MNTHSPSPPPFPLVSLAPAGGTLQRLARADARVPGVGRCRVLDDAATRPRSSVIVTMHVPSLIRVAPGLSQRFRATTEPGHRSGGCRRSLLGETTRLGGGHATTIAVLRRLGARTTTGGVQMRRGINDLPPLTRVTCWAVADARTKLAECMTHDADGLTPADQEGLLLLNVAYVAAEEADIARRNREHMERHGQASPWLARKLRELHRDMDGQLAA